jgi:NAD(P)-dependent dehydrogenase (short-subunit alcohol dehydrogenase family)
MMKSKVVIFGATGGMGSVVAKRLAGAGYPLHLVARDKRKLEDMAAKLNASSTVGDVRDEGHFAQVAEDAGESLGGLVYAVGTLNLKGLNRLTADGMAEDFKVNALGAALAVQALTPNLRKNETSASVVLFSSVAAEQGFKLHASMGMAKGAVRGLTLALAAELAPKIRVNAISPSLTQTDMAESLFANEKLAEAIGKLHAMERLGTPEDMASMVQFLISEDSTWVTGQIFGVDGGRSTLRIKS